MAASGNVVFLGRGSQFILADNPDTLNILLVAELQDRIDFLSKIWNIKKSEAEQAILSRQKRRRSFLKIFDPRDPDNPCIYHLVINISRVKLEYAEEMIVWLVKKREEQGHSSDAET